jgi:antitoxin component YwqK of YwqJK toxin-antitoxin module
VAADVLFCASDGTKTFQATYPNGVVRLQFGFYIDAIGDTVKHGPYVAWYPSGDTAYSGWYQQGKKDSLWTEWSGAGEKLLKERWESGVRNGYHWGRDSLCDCPSQGLYASGLRTGRWQFWNGSLHEAGEYKEGIRVGRWVETQGGRSKTESSGQYAGGLKHGEWLSLEGNYKGIWHTCRRLTYKQGELVAEHKTECPSP